MTTIICKFSCSCVYVDCPLKHKIDDLEDRKTIKEFIKAELDKSIHYEDDITITKNPCYFGCLCENRNCHLSHRINIIGRRKIVRHILIKAHEEISTNFRDSLAKMKK